MERERRRKEERADDFRRVWFPFAVRSRGEFLKRGLGLGRSADFLCICMG